MDVSSQFCPNLACLARGKMGEGTIRIHDRKRERYRCTQCRQTFSARRGTMLEGLRKPTEIIVIVVTLLSYGCPVQAIVHAYALDERTVASWSDRAGVHCEQVHHALIETGTLDLVHVQADGDTSERTKHDRMDGSGNDGVHEALVGRDRESDPG